MPSALLPSIAGITILYDSLTGTARMIRNLCCPLFEVPLVPLVITLPLSRSSDYFRYILVAHCEEVRRDMRRW